jgi:hypothetical protein
VDHPRQGKINYHETVSQVDHMHSVRDIRRTYPRYVQSEGYRADGSFAGLALVNYDLTFDDTFQTFTGSVAGNIYAPDVNPLEPGDAAPTITFEGTLTGQRVTVQLTP